LLTAFGTLEMNVPEIATPADGVVQPMGLRESPIARLRRQSFGGAKAAAGARPRLQNLPSKPITVVNPAPPTSIETALELPTRLMLAPNRYAGWAHALTEVTSSSQRTELWHTRLGVRVGGSVDESDAHADARTVRAFWTRDAGFNPTAAPPNPSGPWPDDTTWAAMKSLDRADIVFESASAQTSKGQARTPQAMQVNRLMLTSLGGWLDVRGDFGENALSGLEEWQQHSTMGRDHYIKLVHAGILYPFGHRAVLLLITERKLNGSDAEALWQTAYVVVRQPTVSYDPGTDTNLQALLRQQPFTQVTITTLSTPPLLYTGGPPSGPVQPQLADGTMAFYSFKMVAIDHSGREVHLESPALWVPAPAGQILSGITPSSLEAAFQMMTPSSSLNGQRVTFAPEAPMAMGMMPVTKPGGTTYETQTLSHAGAENAASWPNVGPGGLPFVPQVASASLAIEALRALGSLGNAVDVAYHQQYIANGFGTDTNSSANAGDLLFQLASAAAGGAGVDFSQHSDQSGGFLNPNMGVTALSRALGPVAGAFDTTTMQAASNVASGNFDPTDFFGTILSGLSGAKVFGVFNLTDIIPSGLLDNAPKFLTQALNDVEALVSDVQQLVSLLSNIQNIANGLESAVQMQLQSQLAALNTTVTGITTQATNLVDAVGDAITTPANIDTDVTKALTALGQLPTLLGQVATVLDSFGTELPVGLTNVTSLLRTLADTLNQAIGGVAPTFDVLLKAYAAGQDLVKNLTIKLDWSTPIQGFPGSDKTQYIFDPVGGLILSAELRLKATQGKPAGLDLLCGLEKFDIHLFGGSSTFITIHFLKMQFVLKAGQKADVDVELDKPGIEFQGPLSFVQTLTSIIPLDGFGDPPGISVSTSGIVASFSIGLPTLAVGVFSLSNMSIGAGFKIPFIGDPVSVNFDFCTRDNPFVLTVAFLGGGGFFGIQLNPNGIELLEASFEAGAGIAVDFGVASGSVSAMIGIYFKMEFDATTSSSNATLTGFFRFRGEVDVLGIITASIELYLELTYESSSGKVTGTATLDIDVSVFCFSATVSITATKRFGGANGDPTFFDIMQPAGTPADLALASPFVTPALPYDPWSEYLNAFAA
jgi:hypothetical protein